MTYFLAPFFGDGRPLAESTAEAAADLTTGPWRVPNVLGAIDLRLDPKQPGWCVCKADAAPRGSIHLSDDLGPTTKQADIGMELGYTPASPDVLGIIEELLFLSGRQVALPTRRKRLEIYLGGKIYDRQFLGETDAAFANILARKQSDFDSIKARNRGLARKWLYNECRRFGIPLDEAEKISRDSRDTPLRPTTTLTDDFNDTDGTKLSAHTPSGFSGSWTIVSGTDPDIQSNEVELNTSTAFSARADDDVSTDDHYAQCQHLGTGSNRQFGPCARYSASAETYYQYAHDRDGAVVIGDNLYKNESGSVTSIDSATTLNGANKTIKVECDGSTIKGYIDGVEYLSATDTDITGNTRGGIDKVNAASGGMAIDDFEIGDLPVATGNPWNYYAQVA